MSLTPFTNTPRLNQHLAYTLSFNSDANSIKRLITIEDYFIIIGALKSIKIFPED